MRLLLASVLVFAVGLFATPAADARLTYREALSAQAWYVGNIAMGMLMDGTASAITAHGGKRRECDRLTARELMCPYRMVLRDRHDRRIGTVKAFTIATKRHGRVVATWTHPEWVRARHATRTA